MRKFLLTSVIILGCVSLASAQQSKRKGSSHPKTAQQKAQQQAYIAKRTAEKHAAEAKYRNPSDKIEKAVLPTAVKPN